MSVAMAFAVAPTAKNVSGEISLALRPSRIYLFNVSYTMKCIAGFDTNTNEGPVPLHNRAMPSVFTILHRPSG